MKTLNRFKTIFWIPILALLLHPLYAPYSALVYPKDLHVALDNYFQEIDSESIQRVSVQTSDGIITVRGYEGETVLINAEYKASGKKEKVCRSLLKKIEVVTSINNNELEIEFKVKDRRKYDIKTFIEISVPMDFSVDADIKHGLIFVYDINGSADLKVNNGDLTAERIQGGLSFFSFNGSIFLKDVAGAVSGLAANGSITCESCELMPSSLDLTSGNGNIRFDMHKLPNAALEANAANGFIHISGIEDIISNRYIGNYETRFGTGQDNYELQTLNGSISLNMISAL